VTQVGIAGFSFIVEGSIDGFTGTRLTGIRLEVGDCVLLGDFVVKHTESVDEGSSFCGGLFIPADAESALRLEGIVHGLEVADRSG
jgi:hypothetical protein